MGKQSSRIYGIKVKEHRNYFEYPAENPEIKIYYDANASKQWIIKSNYNSIWYNGQSYPSGYTVISFKDGTDCQNNPFMLMAPHEEDGIIVNYFYRITGRFTSYPQIELNEEFDISEETVIPEPTEDDSDNIRYTIESGHPGNHYSQLYVRKFINNEEVGHTIVTPESINAYKVAHSSNYYNYLKVFNALLFDWRGMAPSIYEEPYSFILYSNVTYLEWNGITRMRHTKITEWTWDTEVNMDIQDFSRQYDPVEPSDKDVIKYNIASNSNNSEIINVQKMVNNSVVVTKSVSKNDILSYKNTNHGNPLRVFDNLLFDCLQLPKSYPNYTFVIKADNSYLKYNGDWINYGNDIVSWPTNAFVNFEIEDYSNRYEQQVSEGDNYNVYIEHIKWNSQYQYWVNVDSPIALTKDEVCYDIFHDHKEMYYNNHYHKAAWLVYDQPSEGYKKIGKLAIMYADPFWVLITTADGIYWNGHTYKGRKLLKMWKDDEAVDLTMTRTESRKRTTFGNEYDRIRYTVITNNGDSKIKLTKYINDIKSTESIFNPLTTEQRTFSGIVLYCVDTSVILMYSKSDDLTVDGIPYTTNEKIGEWLISEKVSYSINDKDYQKVNYVITTSELNNTITLIKQINDLEDDTVVFDPETDCPLNFYNIRFAYSNGKVSVYSKCDYIKLSGSTYKKGNLITDWPLEEKVNFAIQDESDKYEVTKITTYTVKTENVTETDYDIITLMDEHWTPLKICKINNGRTSNEEIVNFYDCQYEPYFNYDNKLQLIYDPATTYWTLKSLSDEIYKDNVNYPEGSVIDTWPYGTDKHIYGVGHQDISHYEIRLHSIEVDSKASYETTHEYITNPTYTIITQPDHSLDVTNNQPGSLPVTINIRYMDAIDWYTFFGLKIKYNTTTSEWEVKAGNNLIVVGQILYKKGDIVSKWDYYEDIDKTINTLVEDIKHTTRNDKEKDLLVSSKNFWLYGYIWQKETSPGPTPTPDMYRYYIIPVFIPDNYRDSGLYGNGYRYIALIRVEFGHRFVKKVAYNGYYNRINALDEFEIFNDDLMYSLNMNSGKGMYKYYKWYPSGPRDDDNWSYSYEFPYNSGNYTIYYHNFNTKITFGFSRYYTDENGEGWRIIKRVYNDEYLIDYTEYINEIFYPDFVGFPWLDHKCNGYFNGEKHYYANGAQAGIMSYIDKGDYLLLFGNSCLADSRDVTIENRCISAKLYINNLELISFNTQVPIDLQVLRSDAISRGLPNNNRTQASLSSALMTAGKYQLYYVDVQNSEPWFMTDPFKVIYTYKYDVEENTIVQKGVYKIYDIVNNFIDPNKMYDVPWHIPDVISNGKGYSYYRTPDNEKLEVYEIEDPYDFESIYSGGQKVAEYNLNESIGIFNLTTKVASQFTYDALFYTTRAYNNSSAVSKCEYYDTSINRFLSDNDKKGMFRYVYNNDNNIDPMIVYFPDPTLEDISSAFFFKTSDLRYSSEINEEST